MSSFDEIRSKVSSLEKPEKTTLYILLAILGCVGFYFWGVIAPFIVMALKNAVYTAILSVVVLGFVGLVFNNEFRFKIKLLYKVVVRKILGIFLNIDALESMKALYQEMVSESNDLKTQLGKLEGQKDFLEQKANKLSRDLETTLTQMKSVEGDADTDQFNLLSLQATGFQDGLNLIEPLYHDLTAALEAFYIIQKANKFNLEKMKIEISNVELQYNIIGDLWKTSKIIKGLTSQDSERAMTYFNLKESVEKKISIRAGEVKQTLRDSKELVASVDSQTGVMTAQGRNLLEKYKNGTLNLNILKDKENPDGKLAISSNKFGTSVNTQKYSNLIT